MLNKNFKQADEEAAGLTLLISEEILQQDRKAEIGELISRGSIDWLRFRDYIIYHDLIPFAYVSLKSCLSLLPDFLVIFLKNNYYANILRFQLLEQEFLRIHQAFQQKGIVIFPIKGMGLFDYYKDLSLRQMSDIDILLEERYFNVAAEIFDQMGYAKYLMGSSEEYWKRKQCAITFHKQKDKFDYLIDLHWALDFKRHNGRGLPNLWGRTKEVDYGKTQISLLSDEDNFFSLALHNRRFGKVLCLKNVCDIALILNKPDLKFDWDYVLKESRESQFGATVLYALYQTKILFGLDIPDFVLKGLKVQLWKHKSIQGFIQRNSFLPSQNNRIRDLYLKSHFLLYDSFYEPVGYIFNIPIEQFAKFFRLRQGNILTVLCYHLRWIYMPLGYLLIRLKRNKGLKDGHSAGLSR